MIDQECLTLYPLNYSNVEAINSFEERVDSNAFGDCLRKSNEENRTSASLLQNEKGEHYVLILGNDYIKQVEVLKECGINLGKSLKRFNNLKSLIKRKSSEKFYSLNDLSKRLG